MFTDLERKLMDDNVSPVGSLSNEICWSGFDLDFLVTDDLEDVESRRKDQGGAT